MTGHKTMFQNIVERMLHACQRLGGIIILVVDMQIAVAHSLSGLLGQQIVIDKRLCGFGCELHHHPRRRIGIHICILAGDVVVLRLYDFKKNVAGFSPPCDTALVAVCDITFRHLFAGRFHQLQFHSVLNAFHTHLLVAGGADAVHYSVNERFILTHRGGEHGLSDGGFDFFFVVSNNAAIAFQYSLDH